MVMAFDHRGLKVTAPDKVFSAGEDIGHHGFRVPLPRDFQLEIFRMGYYGGRGARLMKTYSRITGKTQPTPTPGEKNLHECVWQPSVSLTIPEDWISGVYLGRMTTIPGRERSVLAKAMSSLL